MTASAVLNQVYQLRPYDLTQPFWSPLYFAEVVTGSAAITVAGTQQTPSEELIWFVTHTFVRASPFATVIARIIEVRLLNEQGNVIALPGQSRLPASDEQAGQTVLFTIPCDFVVLGGVNFLEGRTQYAFGDASNTFTWGFMGYQVPRGNVALR
jgi:hypothetical protein